MKQNGKITWFYIYSHCAFGGDVLILLLIYFFFHLHFGTFQRRRRVRTM